MRSLARWLASRRPTAPPGLSVRLLGHDGEGPIPRLLAARGRMELDRARGALGTVRESAFDLLAADALVTYACEAALESPDPSGTLAELIGEVAEA